MITYSCIRARSTSKSSFKLVGVGKICAYTGSLCLGVSLILNSVLMPMSKWWRAKIMWYLTSSDSTLCCSCSSQLKFLRNVCRWSSSNVGSSFSASRSFMIPSYIRRTFLLSFSGLSHVSGVGYHRLSVVACDGTTCWSRCELHQGIWKSVSVVPWSWVVCFWPDLELVFWILQVLYSRGLLLRGPGGW